jgi:hypothetical protein
MNGDIINKTIRALAFAASLALVFVSTRSSGLEPLRNSPFGYGEDIPDLVATCEDIRSWARKAPKAEARISLAIRANCLASMPTAPLSI